MSGAGPRRDNGLTAMSYARLDDVETHLVDELLGRLAQAGVAAYSAPTTGRRGPYGDTVPPVGPSDSVYVDAAHHDRARAVTDLYLREIRDDLAWSDIVAGFDLDTADVDNGVPRWPVSEDVDTEDGGVADTLESGRQPLGPTIGFGRRTTRTTTSGRLLRHRCPSPTGSGASRGPARSAARPCWCWPPCSACAWRGGSGCWPWSASWQASSRSSPG